MMTHFPLVYRKLVSLGSPLRTFATPLSNWGRLANTNSKRRDITKWRSDTEWRIAHLNKERRAGFRYLWRKLGNFGDGQEQVETHATTRPVRLYKQKDQINRAWHAMLWPWRNKTVEPSTNMAVVQVACRPFNRQVILAVSKYKNSVTAKESQQKLTTSFLTGYNSQFILDMTRHCVRNRNGADCTSMCRNNVLTK